MSIYSGRDTSSDNTISEVWMSIEPMLDCFKHLISLADKEAIQTSYISESLQDEVMEAFEILSNSLNDKIGITSDLSEEVKATIGQKIHLQMLPYLLLTNSIERIYSKPRGYAGDFLMINSIYQNRPAGVGRVGSLIDRCFLDMPPAIAVRNRRKLLVDEINTAISSKNDDEPTRITSLASGPAAEVFDVYEELEKSSRLKMTLIDIDYQSLAYVDDKATSLSVNKHLQLHHGNLVYLALGRQKLELEQQDLIYSIGLIDYFNDKFVLAMINYIYENLADNGKVILGNFHPNNPTKALMDHILDWRLTHRTEDEINQLFAKSKFGTRCTEILFEEQKINMFAVCVKS